MVHSPDPKAVSEALNAARSFTLDVDSLLRPVTVEQPAGSDLRYEGTYDAIREARRADDPTLPQGVWVTDLKRANWREVTRLCADALTTKSKDLQIAAWMVEALVQEKGLPGLREGLHLVRSLCEAFWDDMHPAIGAEGDQDARIAPLVWLNERVPQLLRLLPVALPDTGDDRPFSWEDWENTNRLEILARRDRSAREKAEAEGKPSRAKFLTAVTLTPVGFYSDLVAGTRQCLTALADIAALVEEKCGAEGPSFATLRNLLDDIHTWAADNFREKGGVEEPLAEGDGESQGFASADDAEAVAALPSVIRSRDEAYRMLSLASDYLMKAEPHSPTPYLVRRAVAWGSMSLDELLHELIANEQDLSQLFSLLGMTKLPIKG
jgi:type VI secretion system protein ImpA